MVSSTQRAPVYDGEIVDACDTPSAWDPPDLTLVELRYTNKVDELRTKDRGDGLLERGSEPTVAVNLVVEESQDFSDAVLLVYGREPHGEVGDLPPTYVRDSRPGLNGSHIAREVRATDHVSEVSLRK
jgi:hypothetical protein